MPAMLAVVPMIAIVAMAATVALADAGAGQPAAAEALEPIAYVIRIPAPDTHEIVVQATVPASGRASLDLMMPTWSPGYYRVEDYAANVRDVIAETLDGQPLAVEKTNRNHWRVGTRGERAVKLSYRVFCHQRTVTTNYVDADYGVFNGAPTFITLAENAKRPHDVRIELPPGWTAAMTGLDDAPGGRPNEFRATDYEMLVDSPIVAGKLGIRTFDVSGKKHFVVSAGDVDGWDGDRATRDLQTFVEENRRFWGFLPYEKYVFLLLFRPGGGGLEHRNSNLSTVVAKPRPRADGVPAPADARWPSLGLQAHEYFHLFNVKRLRPIELGPFNFEKAPTTGSLWISEGVTSYYSGLLMTRAGLQTTDEYLASLSSVIGSLQKSPGRLLQSVERSSLEVWENSNSGINAKDTTVSYYVKGNVLGLLLDAKIRRATNGRASLDDVIRLAYRRYSGERGFTAAEFRQTTEEIAGVDLRQWFTSAVSSTDELDYTDLLEWYGLRFVRPSPEAGSWTLERHPKQTAEQRQRLAQWLEK
jgi:predicted metalloprotease with PDZ domain